MKNIKARLYFLPISFHSIPNGAKIRAAISKSPFITLFTKILPLREPAFSPIKRVANIPDICRD